MRESLYRDLRSSVHVYKLIRDIRVREGHYGKVSGIGLVTGKGAWDGLWRNELSESLLTYYLDSCNTVQGAFYVFFTGRGYGEFDCISLYDTIGATSI